ncbi:MAG: hypothetical protein U0Q20_01075 [Mycobacterium sp.]
MDKTTVDLNLLRATADRVQRSADALGLLRMPELNSADLPGSEVADVMGSAKLADYFEVVIIAMEDWALVARRSADAFESAEQQAAIGVGESWSAPR